MTILLYIRRKGWEIDSLEIESTHKRVKCRHESDCEVGCDKWIELIDRHIRIEGNLDALQQDKITRVSRKCPIHKTLEASPLIQDVVSVVGTA
tara:strand:+ start:1423 stop:1701 length:279 start_codon:yes stop_codon:yes gene_type:complete